jgi:hypothetical protein
MWSAAPAEAFQIRAIGMPEKLDSIVTKLGRCPLSSVWSNLSSRNFDQLLDGSKAPFSHQS